MKIALITVCLNEERMLPFFFRHYQQYVDEFVFFDNMSTDRSVEIIKSHPNTRVIKYNTNGYHMEEVMTLIRNTAYQQLPLNADWYLVLDVDEFVYHENLMAYLQQCMDAGITSPKIHGYNMYCDTRPEDDEKSQIYDQCHYGMRSNAFDKSVIIHKSVDIHFSYGSHHSNPKGNVKISPTAEVKLLHYRFDNIGNTPEERHEKLKTKFTRRTNELIPRGSSCVNQFDIPEYILREFKTDVFDDGLEKKIEELTQLAEDGANACFHLGLLYNLGHVVDKDVEVSLKWFNKTAEDKHPYAAYMLAMHYSLGVHVKVSKALAKEWYTVGAELGHTESQFQLGVMLLNGDGVDKDVEGGLKWLKDASTNGHGEADYQLVHIYSAQSDLQDLELVEKHLRLGVEKDDITCMFSLGATLCNKGEYVESLKWLKKSAQWGRNDAYDAIDMIYDNSLGIPDDMDGAIEWYEYHLERQLGIKWL